MGVKEAKVKELTQLSGEPGFWNNLGEAKKVLQELSELKKEVEAIEEVELHLLDLGEKKEISEKEIEDIEKKLHELELETFLNGEFDKNPAIITFISGAGGHDAQEWTTMLLEMYQKYAAKHGWKTELLHQSFGELGGTKEATLEVEGPFAYGFLKKESGVHRLVRISPFSAKKLRHTSFALVQVLPQLKEIENVEALIDAKDVRVDLFRSSGPGGQNVNRRETAVRVTHIPTGISAASQSQRSQLQNRKKALELLYAKLRQLMEAKHIENIKSLRGEVKVEWGHQIRSYVFDPYRLVKDHRTGVQTSDVEGVLEGELDKFIGAELLHTS